MEFQPFSSILDTQNLCGGRNQGLSEKGEGSFVKKSGILSSEFYFISDIANQD